MRHRRDTPTAPPEQKVWDPFVRIGHWTLALAFVTAYLSAEDFEDVHVFAGWWVGGYVLARTIWGFVGSRHARFADFLQPPRAVFGYLRGLLRGNAPHFMGHNPAGGAMVVALLLALCGTAVSGLLLQGESEHEGPFAALFANAAPAPSVAVGADDSEPSEPQAESAYEEVHELFANVTLALIGLHLLGVLASSIVHRENLPRAMATGRKRPSDRLP